MSISRKRAFTVTEVLMVVILLAAILAFVIINFFAFEGALEKRPVLEQVKRSIAEAHWLVRTELRPIDLYYDEEAKAMLLINPEGLLRARFNFPPSSGVQVKFVRILPETQFEAEPTFEAEDEPISRLRFEPGGASLPFYVEVDDGRRAISLRFDPFSAILWETSDAQ